VYKTREKTKRSTCPGQCKRDAFREWKDNVRHYYCIGKNNTERTIDPLGDFSSSPRFGCSVHSCTTTPRSPPPRVRVRIPACWPSCPRDNAHRPRCLHILHRGGVRPQTTVYRGGGSGCTGSSQIKVRFLFVLGPLIKKKISRV